VTNVRHDARYVVRIHQNSSAISGLLLFSAPSRSGYREVWREGGRQADVRHG
jgi:hypothetical protein